MGNTGTDKTESGERQDGSHRESNSRIAELRWAIVGGILTAIALFVGIAVVGKIGSFEALRLLESVLPTIRFLSSSVMTAAVTVLALMLTLLGLTYSTRWEFRETHYQRIAQISWLATITMVLSVGILLFLGIPLEAADRLRTYYNVIYYVLSASGAIIGGLLVSTVLLLMQTIRGLVAIGHPDGKSDLIEDTPEPEHDDAGSVAVGAPS